MKKLFLIITLFGFLFAACGGSPSTETKKVDTSTTASTETIHEATLNQVNGLCDMCKATIEKAAMNRPNIKSAVWNTDVKTLKLTSLEAIDLASVSKAVASVGYDTELDKAEASVYETLPSCCKYR